MRSTALIKLFSVVPYKIAQMFTFFKNTPYKDISQSNVTIYKRTSNEGLWLAAFLYFCGEKIIYKA